MAPKHQFICDINFQKSFASLLFSAHRCVPSRPSGWPLRRRLVMSVCYRSPHSTWSSHWDDFLIPVCVCACVHCRTGGNQLCICSALSHKACISTYLRCVIEKPELWYQCWTPQLWLLSMFHSAGRHTGTTVFSRLLLLLLIFFFPPVCSILCVSAFTFLFLWSNGKFHIL